MHIMMATSILVAVVLIARAWKAAHCWDGGLSPSEHLLIFLLMTGMFNTGGFHLILNLSAWRLLIWIMLVIGLLVKGRPAMSRLTAVDLPIVLYGAFLLWCFLRFLDTPSVMYGVRNLLKLGYPFMVLLLARKAARPGHLGVYLVPTIGACLVVSIFCSGISEKIPYLVYNPFMYGVFWPRATFADHAAIMVGVILVVLWFYRYSMPASTRRLYTMGAIWLILSPLVVACRTGLLATTAVISGYSLARYKVKALPVMGGLFLLGASAFAFLPWVRANTFYDSGKVEFHDVIRGDIDLSNVNSSGRFEMWKTLMDRFYDPDPWMGSGLGALQYEMYEGADYGVKAAHSGYVTILCDTGLVGLILYLAAAFTAIGRAVMCLRGRMPPEVRAVAVIVLTSFLACLSAMAFDLVVLYTLAVHSLPFAFTGILLGLINNAPAEPVADPWAWSRQYTLWRLFSSRTMPGSPAGIPRMPAPR